MNYSNAEEVSLLKKIFQKYGRFISVAIIIIIFAIFAYKAYQKNQIETEVAASQLYQRLLEVMQVTRGQPLTEAQHSTCKYVIETLQSTYKNSQYAIFATLFQVREHVFNNDLDNALAALEWILSHNNDRIIDLLARSRLARIMLSQSSKNAQPVLDILAKIQSDTSFVTAIEEVRGDAYLSLDQKDKARESYKKALNAAHINGEFRPFLQFKLDDLAEAENVERGL